MASKNSTRDGHAVYFPLLDEVWQIGVVGQADAVMGVRVVSTKMGNVPQRQAHLNTYKPPAISWPQTFFFQQ